MVENWKHHIRAVNSYHLLSYSHLLLIYLLTIQVEVVSARNLPEMKKLSHSADPYIELSLISDTSSNVTTEGSEVARTSVQVFFFKKYSYECFFALYFIYVFSLFSVSIQCWFLLIFISFRYFLYLLLIFNFIFTSHFLLLFLLFFFCFSFSL